MERSFKFHDSRKGDGEIDIDEIYRYVNQKVPEMTDRTQHPDIKGEAEGLVIVGHVR